MRQVPHFLLIGNGRVATHFCHYFSLLSLSFDHWHRKVSLTQLHQHLEKTTHILLLIHDDAIEEFITTHLSSSSATCIHFSGSLSTEKAFGAHPLMTFNDALYDLHHYTSIPFVVDDHAPDFADLLPGLPNPSARLPTALKAKYHAFCVLSGNFSCLLWQQFFSHLEKNFQIPADIAHPYLLQLTRNLITNSATAFTGPLQRRDKKTIQKNLAALKDDPAQLIYQQFIDYYDALLSPNFNPLNEEK